MPTAKISVPFSTDVPRLRAHGLCIAEREVTMRQTFLRTSGTAALVALALCATQPAAQARGIGVGGAVALGILGGVVAGSAIASANSGYYPGRQVYAAPDPYGACHFERRAYVDPYGYEHIQRVEVCE
uniref:hypothetical protein n=1 Tax=Methylobacterium oryzae TaxID=334852 RepID=UPI001FCE3967|nr:hypothetical protein [Methylobacterium oryzae]